MASVRLFVYGSLKRGGRHHGELAGAVFLGEATTLPGYRLEPRGEYLALVSVPPEPPPERAPTTSAPAAPPLAAAAAQPLAVAAAQPLAAAAAAKPLAVAAAKPLAEAKAQPKPEHETDTETATAVSGELFELDESKLSALDAFEGEEYERGNVRLVGLPFEKPGLALAYFGKAR